VVLEFDALVLLMVKLSARTYEPVDRIKALFVPVLIFVLLIVASPEPAVSWLNVSAELAAIVHETLDEPPRVSVPTVSIASTVVVAETEPVYWAVAPTSLGMPFSQFPAEFQLPLATFHVDCP